MGTKEIELEQYKRLLKLFDSLLHEKGYTLRAFAKDFNEEKKYYTKFEKFYDKLRKRKKRREDKNRKRGMASVNKKELSELKEFVKYLDDELKTIELHADERLDTL